MSSETPKHSVPFAADEIHRQARLEVLYAYRGEFRKEAPAGMLPADSVDVSCMDRRVDEKKYQKQADGESYHFRNAGAVFAAYKEGVDAISAPGQVALDVAMPNFPDIHIVRVTGHTDCGAVKKLYETLRRDASPEELAEKAWMLPVPLENVKHAVDKAKENGASDEELRVKLEQLAVLGSMADFYTYPVKNPETGKSLKDEDTGNPVLVSDYAKKGLIIAGGVRDVVPDENGHRALLVFDPGEKHFIPVEALYQKLFPGQEPSAGVIEDAFKARKAVAKPQKQALAGDIPSSLMVPMGATSTTVAEMNIEDLKAGMQTLLNEIGQTKGVRK